MFTNILVVCVGNICRSPLAEAMLKQQLAAKGKRISSAGLQAMVDHAADAHTVELATAAGIDLSGHKARQLTRAMIADADLILTMEQRHVEDITKLAPQARGKTMLLGRWLNNKEVPDPYRKSTEAFQLSHSLIQQATTAWLKYL